MLVTFIRHGESTDNLKPLWAGWTDSPLSNHGMNQARALGLALQDAPFTAIYCSDLKRAHTTAQQLIAPKEDPPTLIVNPLLREQHFGIAEGKPWAPSASAAAQFGGQQVFITLPNRHEKFSGGESLEDLAARADAAIDECIWPHVEEALNLTEEEQKKMHIVIVSHGLCIYELIARLLKRSPVAPETPASYRGLANTGWTQVEVDIEEGKLQQIHLVTVNNSEHLTNIKRQGGGIGSAPHDEKQTTIKEFFGGGGAPRNE